MQPLGRETQEYSCDDVSLGWTHVCCLSSDGQTSLATGSEIPTTPSCRELAADIVIMMDASSSIQSTGWANQNDLFKEITAKFSDAPGVRLVHCFRAPWIFFCRDSRSTLEVQYLASSHVLFLLFNNCTNLHFSLGAELASFVTLPQLKLRFNWIITPKLYLQVSDFKCCRLFGLNN